MYKYNEPYYTLHGKIALAMLKDVEQCLIDFKNNLKFDDQHTRVIQRK